jgi:hypothetical protein
MGSYENVRLSSDQPALSQLFVSLVLTSPITISLNCLVILGLA